MSDRGDLTDVPGWEHTWRSRRASRVPKIVRVQDHGAAFRAFIAHALAARRSPLEVLEVGCAPGDMLRGMTRLAPEHRYSGIDFAPRALDETQRSFAASGVSASLHVADVRSFVAPRAYDLVASFGLIEHFDDPAEIVAHHVRLTASGGSVGVMVPNYAHPALRRALALYSPGTLATHNLTTMSESYLRDLLAHCGLIDIEIGSYGGALVPVAHAIGGPPGWLIRKFAAAWNVTFASLPTYLNPWQGFLWACGRNI